MSISSHYKIDKNGDFCGVYIRKNACSAIKAMILDSIGDTGENLSDIRKMTKHRSCSLKEIHSARVRFFIIRDPFSRLVSGWLNQVVQKLDRVYPEMFNGIADATGKSIRDVTFRDFIKKYLPHKTKINGHFKPQIDHLIPLYYTHILHDAKLHNDASYVFGEKYSRKYFKHPRNSTKHLSALDQSDAIDISAIDLFNTFKSKNILPSKKSFSNIITDNIIYELYMDDFRLYEEYICQRGDSAHPIGMKIEMPREPI